MLKCGQPKGRKVVDYPPKGIQTQLAAEGGRKAITLMIMTMMMMMSIMMMILMMTMVVAICFLHPKGP